MDPLRTPTPHTDTKLPEVTSDKNAAGNSFALDVNDIANDIFDMLNDMAQISEQKSDHEHIKLAAQRDVQIGDQTMQESASIKSESTSIKRESASVKQDAGSSKQIDTNIKAENVETNDKILVEMKSVYIVLKSTVNEAKLVLAHTAAPHELHSAHTQNKLGNVKGDKLHVHSESGWQHGQEINVIDEHGNARILTIHHFTSEEAQQLSLLVTTFIAQHPQPLIHKQEVTSDKKEHEVRHSHKEAKLPIDNREIRYMKDISESDTSKETQTRNKSDIANNKTLALELQKSEFETTATNRQRSAAKKAYQLAKEISYEHSEIIKESIKNYTLTQNVLKDGCRLHVIHTSHTGMNEQSHARAKNFSR